MIKCLRRSSVSIRLLIVYLLAARTPCQARCERVVSPINKYLPLIKLAHAPPPPPPQNMLSMEK